MQTDDDRQTGRQAEKRMAEERERERESGREEVEVRSD
jgi:hypothetical protein